MRYLERIAIGAGESSGELLSSFQGACQFSSGKMYDKTPALGGPRAGILLKRVWRGACLEGFNAVT
jgi:hypothetical protein